MKTRMCSLVMSVAAVAVGFAEVPPDPAAQTKALSQYPALGQTGSPFNKRFVARVNSLRAGMDPVLDQSDWPLVVANQIGSELKIVPVGETAATSPAELAPRKPFVPSSTALNSPTGGGVQSNSLTVTPGRVTLSGTVYQRTSDGIILKTNLKGDGGLVFVSGRDAKSGTKVTVPAVKSGTYNYTTVSGAAKVIDAYAAIVGSNQ